MHLSHCTQEYRRLMRVSGTLIERIAAGSDTLARSCRSIRRTIPLCRSGNHTRHEGRNGKGSSGEKYRGLYSREGA
jgi:hypothetical protein